MGASAPSFGFLSAGSMGSAFSSPCSSPLKVCSFFVSVSSRSVMKASKPALKLNHSSSYTSYGPIVGSIDASSSIHATSLA
jgi:hypothetical protein